MPRQFERVRFILGRDQRKLCIGKQRPRNIAHFTIHTRRQRSLGKTGPDRRRNIGWGGSAGHFSGRAIGKGDADHLGHGKNVLSGVFKKCPFASLRPMPQPRRNGVQRPSQCASLANMERTLDIIGKKCKVTLS